MKTPDRDVSLYSPDPYVWLRLDNVSEAENRTMSYVAVEFIEQGIRAWVAQNPDKACRYPALAALCERDRGET